MNTPNNAATGPTITAPPAPPADTAATESQQVEDQLDAYLCSDLAFADCRLVFENLSEPGKIPPGSLRRIAGAMWARTLMPSRSDSVRMTGLLVDHCFPALTDLIAKGFSMNSEWNLTLAVENAELRQDIDEIREASGLPPRGAGEAKKPQIPILTPEAISQAVREGLAPIFEGLKCTIEKEGRRGALAILQAGGAASPQQMMDAAELWAATEKGTDHGTAA